jgi:hypothetical protein
MTAAEKLQTPTETFVFTDKCARWLLDLELQIQDFLPKLQIEGSQNVSSTFSELLFPEVARMYGNQGTHIGGYRSSRELTCVVKSQESQERKLEVGGEIHDFLRFTVVDSHIPSDIDDININLQNITNWIEDNGWSLHGVKPKHYATGYSDVSLIFRRFDNEGRNIYLEVRYNSTTGADACEEEHSVYETRRNIQREILGLLKFNLEAHTRVANGQAIGRYFKNFLDDWMYERQVEKSNTNSQEAVEVDFLRDLEKDNAIGSLFNQPSNEVRSALQLILENYAKHFLESRLIFEEYNQVITSRKEQEELEKLFLETYNQAFQKKLLKLRAKYS